MRLVIAALALAGALFACASSVDAQGASPREVVSAKRCAPPFGCVRPRARSHADRRGDTAAIDAAAIAEGVPLALARALVRVESGGDSGRRGREGEWGLTQIKCRTARGLGFAGACGQLADPATNLKWGLRHARRALDRGSIGFHQAGLGARHVSPRYVARINAAMEN